MTPPKLTALIVEDESNIGNFISAILQTNAYKTIISKTGEGALALTKSHCPDIILLDLGLPDMDGMEALKSIRSWSSIPIIIISARHQETEKVQALDLGADDYITKPFGTKELLARIRTAMRHSSRLDSQSAPTSVYRAKDLLIDFDKRLVQLEGKEIRLTQIEYKLVSLLAQNSGRVVTYETIIRSLWGPDANMDNQILRVNMANIRRKIEKKPAVPVYIFTEIGVGYRMTENEV
ncbi:MAG: response regulator [Lachnospiraceae bacterium]|jgi:two-component system KDP operon response regulator KdpE